MAVASSIWSVGAVKTKHKDLVALVIGVTEIGVTKIGDAGHSSYKSKSTPS